jgi:phosphate transport system protein
MAQLSLHTSHDFDTEMRSIRTRFAEMSAHCADQVRRAIAAYWNGAADEKAQVAARDRRVNEEEKTLDEMILRVLALRHPVASDLRMLIACFKLITDLERVSDESVGIANAAAAGAPPEGMNLDRLRGLAATAEQMFSAATESFLHEDETLAEQVFQADAAAADLYRDTVADVVAFAARHGEVAGRSVSAMNVARCLERIADHAANIAEGTRFAIHDEDMPR